jgi:aminoglycoside phosphotransferase (APT) family kinase protein
MDTASIIERLTSGARVTESVPLVGGVSAEVHAVTYVLPDGAEDRVVVRRHRNIEGKADRHDRAAREHVLLGLLHERGVAVPQSRLFVPPDTLVLDYIDGSTALPSDPAPALAATLATIHAIEVDKALSALPRLDDPLPGLMEWLPSRLLVGSSAGEGVVREEIRLACGVFEGTARLLHGDYWPGNVMWRNGNLIAVLDWEDAAVGDPLTDVACARVELCCARDETTAERFTEIYTQLAPTNMTRLPWWDLYVCTAALHYMDSWRLAPEVLAQRRATTMRLQAKAFEALGII